MPGSSVGQCLTGYRQEMESGTKTAKTEQDPLGRAAEVSGKLLMVGAAGLILLLLFWALKSILIPVLLAVLISTQLMPAVNWLKARRVPGSLAVGMVVVAGLVLFAAVLTGIVGQIVSESDGIEQSLSDGTNDAAAWVAANSGPLDLTSAEVKSQAEKVGQRVTDSPGPAVQGVMGGLSIAAGLLIGAILTLAFTIYMLGDGGQGFRWFCDRFREPTRGKVTRAGERAWTTLGNYIRGVAMVAVFDAVLIGSALFLLGVPLAGALTAMVFLLAFIPIIGAWASGIIATLVALAGNGIGTATVVAVVSLAVQQLETVAIAPLVYRRAIRLHPMITLASVATGGLLAGVIGAFIAVPLVAVTWAIAEEWTAPTPVQVRE